MIKSRSEGKRSLLVWLVSVLLLCSGPVLAQTEGAEQEEEDVSPDGVTIIGGDEDDDDEDQADLGDVRVTGSRLQQPEYSSISPLQVINADGAREVGLVDTASILQQAPAATGQQIDLTFQGFVLDNGPGASTISLRGLGSARTLVLLNGRRLAPAGVEGAPSQPDLNLVPSGLVRQYDLLLDGASSIYGADAVAGVTNIILRDDFQGLEVELFGQRPEIGAGESVNATVTWGKTFRRGFVGVGLEYEENEPVALRDIDWTDECEKHAEITENGEIRTREQFYTNVFGMEWDGCRLGSLASRISVPFAGSIYHTPGFSNGGWPSFSESSRQGFGVDGDGDGLTDLTFRDYDQNGSPDGQAFQLFPEFDRLSIMSFGEYTFEGDMNNTFYYEANYNQRETYAFSDTPQLFPNVPGTNPFNICNPDGLNGVDCGLAEAALQTNPNYVAQFQNNFADFCASIGVPLEACIPASFGLVPGAIGPADALPIVRVRGDRSSVETEIKQYRALAGFRGSLPFMNNIGSFSSWEYDAAVSFTRSEGDSSRVGIRGDRLEYSLATSRIENGRVVCGNNDGCVPINMFASSLYPVGRAVGDFETQAERDYLFDSRDFDTVYEQTLFTAFVNGFVAQLPGGPMTAGFGVEWRNDDIDSQPDEVARDGLFFGFFADGGADGDKSTSEAFAEVNMPLLANRSLVEELTVNLSGRYTDDEIFGSDTTFSAKVGYRPVPSLLLRSTYGTSYRAPNVREVFLRDQTGFVNVTDPCIIPEAALNPVTGGYDPSLDPRESEVLENCRQQGVDPTTLDNNGFRTLSTEVATGGSLELDEETSTSLSAGFSFEQPFTRAFNMTIGANYYSIEIEDAIIEPTAQFLVNDCFFDPQLDSPFCDRIDRGEDGFIDLVTAGFINRDEEKVRGVDVNLNADKDFLIGERNLNFAIDAVANRSIEASETFIDDEGNVEFDDDQGEFGFPDWQAQVGFRATMEKWRLTWQVRYIGEVEQDVDGIDEFSDIDGIGDTCLGPPDDVLCRDIGFADDYFLNNASLYYYGDTWTLGFGVRNVFDEAPPFVDGTEILSINNVPLGYGYDIRGRTYFLNLAWRP